MALSLLNAEAVGTEDHLLICLLLTCYNKYIYSVYYTPPELRPIGYRLQWLPHAGGSCSCRRVDLLGKDF